MASKVKKTKKVEGTKGWKVINGKKINFKTDKGNIFEAIVIADPNVGVSVKAYDPKEVLSREPNGWSIPPSDPNFFFICTKATEKRGKESFDHWVEILSKDKKYFTTNDIALSVSPFGGSCPFSLK